MYDNIKLDKYDASTNDDEAFNSQSHSKNCYTEQQQKEKIVSAKICIKMNERDEWKGIHWEKKYLYNGHDALNINWYYYRVLSVFI